MKNITFSADERLLRLVRDRARKENTTLNNEFRRWLVSYTGREQQVRQAESTMRELRGKLRVVRKLTRDEMNKR